MSPSRFIRHLSLARSIRGDGPARGYSVTLEVAFRCNVRCVFCSRWSDPTDLKLDTIREIAEDMAGTGAGYVSITGGDPFVRRDIREIIDAFAERGVPIHINTNGVVLKKFAGFLRSRASAFVGITVSIDSPVAAVHDEIRGVAGTFERAMAGIESIRDVIPVSLACTLNQKNLHEIEDYHRFARRHRLPYRFQPLHEDVDNLLTPNQDGVSVEEDDLVGLTARLENTLSPRDGYDKRLYYRLFEPFFRHPKQLDPLTCQTAARLIYFIDPSGNVFPCDSRRDVPLGSVYERPFREIVAGPESTGWRRTCREKKNRCWCMYACVAPNSLRHQDAPLHPLTRSGWPLRGRWDRRIASLTGEPRGNAPEVRAPASEPRDWSVVSAVVASHNGGEFLERNLRSLMELDYPRDRLEIVLVDDASSDGSIERIRKTFTDALDEGRLRIVRNDAALGVAGAYNRGVRESCPRSRFVLKSDNDVLPRPDALKRLVLLALANPRAGILGGRIYYESDRRRIQFLGGNLASSLRGPALMETPKPLLERPEESAPAYLDVINSCMALVRREVFERSGLWPEFYGRYEYEDYDFAFRARRFGYWSLYCPDAVAYHAVSLTSTGNELSDARARLRARNGILFMKRHAPAGWATRFLLYHLAKTPFDLLRGRARPWLQWSGYVAGLRAVRESQRYELLPSTARHAPGAAQLLRVEGSGVAG